MSADAKYCDACGSSISDENKTLKIFSGIGGVVILIIFSSVIRWAVSGGTDRIISESEKSKTEQKLADYFTNTSTWKEFNSTVGKFKAAFPAYPSHETNDIGLPGSTLSLKYDTYAAETSNGNGFLVNTSVYPVEVDTSKPDNNLEGSLNGMLASNDGNKLISSQLIDLDGNRALDFEISNSDSIRLKGRTILADHTMYQLMLVYEKQNYSEEDYTKFINSFELIK